MFSNLLKDKKKLCMLIGGILLIFILIFIVLFFLVNNKLLVKVNNSDGAQIAREYESLNDKISEDGKKYPIVDISSDNVMKYSNLDEILEIFESNGDAVVYFGYATCVYCRTAVQVLCDTAKNTELDVIYYLDVEEKGGRYDELLNVLGDELVDSIDGVRKITSPLVIFVANGKVVSYNKGTLFSQEDPYIVLDNSQISGLSEIYKYGINDVLESKKNKSSGN